MTPLIYIPDSSALSAPATQRRPLASVPTPPTRSHPHTTLCQDVASTWMYHWVAADETTLTLYGMTLIYILVYQPVLFLAQESLRRAAERYRFSQLLYPFM